MNLRFRSVSIGLAFIVPIFISNCGPTSSPENPADWAVYGGNTENTHYTTLNQITPENVASLEVAWTYDTGDDFEGSEMQADLRGR